MKNLFELTEAKKLSAWFIVISIVLFVFAAGLHFFRLLDEGVYQVLIGSHWYPVQTVLIFAAFLSGMMLLLFVLGISLRVLCNNISRLIKLYDDEQYKKKKI